MTYILHQQQLVLLLLALVDELIDLLDAIRGLLVRELLRLALNLCQHGKLAHIIHSIHVHVQFGEDVLGIKLLRHSRPLETIIEVLLHLRWFRVLILSVHFLRLLTQHLHLIKLLIIFVVVDGVLNTSHIEVDLIFLLGGSDLLLAGLLEELVVVTQQLIMNT